MKNNIVALLPIKKNSERVKHKNFRLMAGKPLYQWVLETLLSCDFFTEVFVNTDCTEFIASLNKLYPSVKTALRPSEICGDLISMDRIIEHDINECKNAKYFLQTHTTNPLLTVKTLKNAINMYFKNLEAYDSLFSVNKIQARTYWPNGQAINHDLGNLLRTQDLTPIMEENANFFLFSRESFFKTNSRVGLTPFLHVTPRLESFDIDEEEDFVFVDSLLTLKNIP